MRVSIGVEQRNIIIFFLHGIAILFLKDLLQSWRNVCPHSGIWTGTEDLLFWIAVGFRTFILIFRYQDGVLRLYTGILMSVGMLLYRQIIGNHLVSTISSLLLFLCRFIRQVFSRQKQIIKRHSNAILSKINDFRQKTVAKSDKKEYTKDTNLERDVSK